MHKKTLLAAAILFILPMNSLAASILSFDDLIAGLGGLARITGAPANTKMELVIRKDDRTISIPVTTDAAGDSEVLISGSSVKEAGDYRASLFGKGNSEIDTATATVLPERIDTRTSSVTADRSKIAANGRDEVLVTVHLSDRYGNVLPGRPVELISSRRDDEIHLLSTLTDENGDQQFAVNSTEPGFMILRAFDLLSAQTLDETAEVQVGTSVGGDLYSYANTNSYSAQLVPGAAAAAPTFGELAEFEITVSPSQLKTNEVGNLTIRAVDARGETVEDYTGTVQIYSPTEPDATLPGIGENGKSGFVTFTPKNLGEKFLPLAVGFPSSGEQELVVEDDSDPKNVITGNATVKVTGSSVINSANKIQITSHVQDGYVNSANIILEGIGPKFANLEVTGGSEDAFGESDRDGTFSIPVTLSASQKEFTLRVRDESKRYDSGNLHLILDTVPPAITSVLFTPEKPQQDSDMLLTVEADPKSEVRLKLGTQDFALVESTAKAGNYQVSFKAPPAGKYQPAISAKDPAGNVTEVRSNITIAEKGLPKVLNLKGDARPNSVELHWDALKNETVDHYRIYLGEDPEHLLTLDTADTQTAAIVGSLKAGTPYYFAVTAIKGNRESEEKSDPITVRPLGLAFNVTPQDSALQMQWDFPTDVPLSAFVLEYGVDTPTEKRMINGELRDYTLRDLLNGVEYTLKLTPVTTTGDLMNDLAATGKGKPMATTEGFNPTPGENLPFDPGTVAPDNGLHQGAPSTPSSGIPTAAFWIAGGLALLAGLYEWRRRRARALSLSFFKAVEQHYGPRF
jgi:hypothetical protein